MTKLSAFDVAVIRKMAQMRVPQKEIATHFPVTSSAIHAIVSRKTWRAERMSYIALTRAEKARWRKAALRPMIDGAYLFRRDDGSYARVIA